jgi:FkbM family methyltransferase
MNKMKLIFDIGANSGETVKIFKEVAEKVVAFEPNPTLIEVLKNTFSSGNVVIDPRGLSNEIGRKIFNISSVHTVSTFSQDWIENSRFSNSIGWNYPTEVETTTLDQIIEEYGIPDYVKIDVEGYEYEVLSSLTRVLPETLFSFEWAEEMKDKIYLTVEHANNLGYKSFSFTERDVVLFDSQLEWISYENFLEEIKLLESERMSRWGMIYFKK